ncbi:MAG: DNA polymerase III subunit alpha, partial [Polyangiaceae bacterium]|nr:DNA polymerase III subunit alpha [Polyangiaceae bacterium]
MARHRSLGCEVNVARDTGARGRAAEHVPVDHMVLLAASEKGYHNIVRVVSLGHIQPASEVAPSVSFDTLASNSAGVVMLTGCLGGLVPQALVHDGPDAAVRELTRLRAIADPGHLFVELQDHGLPEQSVVNGILADAAAGLQLPVVATNDVHYARREDADAQLLLSCIQTGASYEDAKMVHHGSREMYLKSPEEMDEVFRGRPDALRNTLRVAEMCTGWKLKLGEPMLPSFALPQGQDTTTYFIKVARDGLQERLEAYRRAGTVIDESLYGKRLEREISVIVEMKFPGYFLIVWDFIRYAKQRGIPVGPGRGSGAGSLVAYAMRITDLDPMPYDLLFERFLNPERVSMPDFDVDFCMDRRDEVIRYVAQKYGVDSVGQIATFHELKARSVIKDVGRAMNVSPSEAQKLASLVPMLGPGKTATIPEALELEPKLKAIVEEGGREAEVVVQAQKLEGLTRHVGMHAAGVVIADGPLWDHVPCFKHGDTLVTQYYMGDVEQAGLVKFDFLGLRTLTVIDIAVRLVHKRPDHDPAAPFDINAIRMDDAKTFALLQSGETTGVFQLESSGMQALFKKLRPDCFEDVIAAVALYRPGPLESGMVDQFVACKHGRQ